MEKDWKKELNEDMRERLPEDLQVDPELIPYLLAAKAPSESLGEAADNRDDATTDGENNQKNPTDKDGLELTDAQLELVEQMRSRQRPASTLGPSTLENPKAKAIYESLLTRRAEHQIEPTLERVQGVLDYLGNPQELFHSIHVTGTNGKTSMARMIEALTDELGYRTGRFTSPHLVDVRERISIDREPITTDQFIAAYEDIEAQLAMWENDNPGSKLSFFEVLTVMAYALFADVPVHLAVVEVGMGGRWDATNVIDADTAVIGPISLEHEQWLGKGLTNIAKEKSGIIKHAANVVVAHQPDEALEVIKAAAHAMDATLRYEGRDFEVIQRVPAVGGQMLTIRTPAATYQDIFLPLFGEFQAENAAVALTAVEAQLGGLALDGDSVARAFASVTSPGRLEVLHASPMIVADAGHNPGAALALARAIEDDLRWTHTVGIYSAMDDKDIETVLGVMEPVMGEIIVTTMPGERPAKLEKLQEIAEEVFGEDRVYALDGLTEAIGKAGELDDLQEAPPGSTGVMIFGSVVLAGMARKVLNQG
ncbi:MAG: bifunctional folylpolyglutamate synthase/dihydrofolate synthase [Mobiluncus sp.]|uniref:bifunctional folylpolyglutamate synthase/dihydrofolate synthase n=1 Tax=Mobiluncus sp. TaxID=47293 RepID=UPI002582A7E5|nr:folylpolyglutamate synthase/dihydrofolate synthase family protein [Mobiluncus sp.]MCI6583654.1 bifunctional folylpolyglutamate synthase/dihydrofolate synthase [Mobiluncus sp.]